MPHIRSQVIHRPGHEFTLPAAIAHKGVVEGALARQPLQHRTIERARRPEVHHWVLLHAKDLPWKKTCVRTDNALHVVIF